MKSAVFCFGRFNPPTLAHVRMIESAKRVAEMTDADFLLFPSRTIDKTPKTKPKDPTKSRNPLDFATKYAILTELLPTVNIVDDPDVKSPQQVIDYLSDRGYQHVRFAVGSDRQEEFVSRWLPYALEEFDRAGVIDVLTRDESAKGIAGLSGTKARAAVLNRDRHGFTYAVGNGLPPKLVEHMWQQVRRGMGLDGAEGQSIQGQTISS